MGKGPLSPTNLDNIDQSYSLSCCTLTTTILLFVILGPEMLHVVIHTELFYFAHITFIILLYITTMGKCITLYLPV